MGRNQRDFDREIESHLELETERLIAEGMAPTEARAAARRAFGNVGQAKERFFERGRIRWLDQLLRDVGYSLRGLAARPGFTLAAIITLALGIGLNSALFSLMYWVAARPFPVRDAHRIVNVYQNVQNGGGRTTTGPWTWVSFPEYRRYRDGSRSFDELAAYRGVDLVFGGDRPRPVQGSLVSCNYFRALQVVIPLGRGLADDDCRVAGGAPVAVMAAQLWRNEFGSDPNLVGKQLTVNGVTAVVIGVAEPGFGGIDWRPADLWFPITMQPTLTHRSNETLERERSSWLTMVGRLRAGVSRQSAEAELAVVGQRPATRGAGFRSSSRRVRCSTSPG